MIYECPICNKNTREAGQIVCSACYSHIISENNEHECDDSCEHFTARFGED